jgi:hypothetical protein
MVQGREVSAGVTADMSLGALDPFCLRQNGVLVVVLVLVPPAGHRAVLAGR